MSDDDADDDDSSDDDDDDDNDDIENDVNHLAYAEGIDRSSSSSTSE
jgi:hypothetical protein